MYEVLHVAQITYIRDLSVHFLADNSKVSLTWDMLQHKLKKRSPCKKLFDEFFLPEYTQRPVKNTENQEQEICVPTKRKKFKKYVKCSNQTKLKSLDSQIGPGKRSFHKGVQHFFHEMKTKADRALQLTEYQTKSCFQLQATVKTWSRVWLHSHE